MNVYELVGELVSKVMQRFSDALVIVDIDFDDEEIIRVSAVWEIKRNAEVQEER